ncbi:hypothetical protein HNP84_003668 [Thermocatellispora tengchongensis]|uniref:DivIVA domain-containing protein n=1 Tax=Thermocatellispora tengchongensis TaxID=1073253 RepID=A0A840P3J7_9ACTN|nr:hypothetical protein [Thermocatellispora tengchongensis]MBB5133942.1 hypothetical protein [Thermocatellispora tengchongensis]
MLVVLALAALAIVAGVVLVAMGRGGELTEFPPDVPPLDLPDAGQLAAVDFMALQLPVSLVGYHTQSVDETLRRAAGAISARDTKIAVLEQRVTELLASRLYARQEAQATPTRPAHRPRTDHEPQGPPDLPTLPESGDPTPSHGHHPPYEAREESPKDTEDGKDAKDAKDTEDAEHIEDAKQAEDAAEAKDAEEPADSRKPL